MTNRAVHPFSPSLELTCDMDSEASMVPQFTNGFMLISIISTFPPQNCALPN